MTLKGINTTQMAIVAVVAYQAALSIGTKLAPDSDFTHILASQQDTVSWIAGIFGLQGAAQARAGRMNVGDLWTKADQPGPNMADFLAKPVSSASTVPMPSQPIDSPVVIDSIEPTEEAPQLTTAQYLAQVQRTTSPR